MKTNLFKNKLLFHITLFVIIMFGMVGCDNDKYNEQNYYGSGKLVITNEQVWLRNYSTNRLSQLYEKCNNNHNITVFSEYIKEIDSIPEIGTGIIDKGKLSFTVNVPENLLEWDELKVLFNIIVENEGWVVNIDESTTKGTFIQHVADENKYLLIREGVTGTSSSISDETVFFVYVNKDCTITGKSKVDERVMYTFYPFTLKLKKGWNTVWYKQTYTTSGKSSFYMDIKNPDLKWVLIPNVLTM